MCETAPARALKLRPKPPVKWAGGKGQLLNQFKSLFLRKVECLVEPFLGGGAVFLLFDTAPGIPVG